MPRTLRPLTPAMAAEDFALDGITRLWPRQLLQAFLVRLLSGVLLVSLAVIFLALLFGDLNDPFTFTGAVQFRGWHFVPLAAYTLRLSVSVLRWKWPTEWVWLTKRFVNSHWRIRRFVRGY